MSLFILVLIPTALLICIENAFWDINRDGNFVELFKKSLTFYVESGLREITERDIDILRNKQGGFSVTKDFNAKFYQFIVDHYLRKFHYFYYLHSAHLIIDFAYKIQPDLGISGFVPVENQPVGNLSHRLAVGKRGGKKKVGFESWCTNSRGPRVPDMMGPDFFTSWNNVNNDFGLSKISAKCFIAEPLRKTWWWLWQNTLYYDFHFHCCHTPHFSPFLDLFSFH